MIPLSPLSGNNFRSPLPLKIAVRGFRPIEGEPRDIRVDFGWDNLPGLTAAQRAGLRYEARAQFYLKETLSGYCPSPIFEFKDDSGPRKCVPDGIFLPHDTRMGTFVFEIKSNHVPEAWFQLRKLYQPVSSKALGGRQVGVVEVCRSYDPAVSVGEAVYLIDDLADWVKKPRTAYGVFVWRG